VARRLEKGFELADQAPFREARTKQRTKGMFGEDQERINAGQSEFRMGTQPFALFDRRTDEATL
jgi:hypothetical protein